MVTSTGTNTWDFLAEYATNLLADPQVWMEITNAANVEAGSTNTATFLLPDPNANPIYIRVNQVPPE